MTNLAHPEKVEAAACAAVSAGGGGRTGRVGSTALLSRTGAGQAVEIERMPTPDIRQMVPMRDGTRLDTWVWLPKGLSRAPAILSRTPYQEHVLGWARLGQMRYVEAGYALVYQLIRGQGRSEGVFSFSAPHEKTDGYDTVEWIAAQPWCDGGVGMDGGSYAGMTQLSAAAARPPHLRCIAPHVIVADFFREIPYFGGGFSRQHTLNWSNLIQANSLAELTGGFISVMPVLSQPDWLRRVTLRPARDAAEGVLRGDKLDHYRDVLAHPTFDGWWRERTLGPAEFAAMDLPMLIVTGLFDLSIGPLMLWRGLAEHAPDRPDRYLLIGPWDHGGSYVGSDGQFGPFDLGPESVADPYEIRLAFFDRHLKGEGLGPDLGGKAKIFIGGRNVWQSFDAYPPKDIQVRELFLASAGRANSLRGDGRLLDAPQERGGQADVMGADPRLPYVPAMTSALDLQLDLRELARDGESLVYLSAPLAAPLRVLGEPEVELHVSADAPDADVGAYLAEVRPDGMIAQLARHFLRLRYREGFDKEVLLTPGEPVTARIRLTFVSHELSPGCRLALILRPDMFPWIDPNPHTGEPIAAAVELRPAEVSVIHDADHLSRLILPVLQDHG